MALKLVPSMLRAVRLTGVRAMSQVGGYGEGSGKGGGSGGSIREAGGTFGKMEAAHEEEYFRKLNAQNMEEIIKKVHKEEKAHLQDNIDHLEDNIKANQDSLARNKKRLAQLERMEDSDSD